MKKLLLHSTFAGLLCLLITISSLAHAGIIHTFTFEDVAQWDEIRGITNGDSLSIMFDDGTDFNNVQWSDIEYFQYNLSVGDTHKVNSDFVTFGEAKELFAESNGIVSIQLDRLGPENYIYGYNSISKMLGQIQSGNLSYFYAHYYPFSTAGPDAAYLGLIDGLTNITYSSQTSAQVSEPSTLAIFSLAMLGLCSRRMKQKNSPTIQALKYGKH